MITRVTPPVSHALNTVFSHIALICMFLCIPFSNFAQTKIFAAVVLNEIYPKPTDEQSEWIELYNSGNESVSLNLWKLENTDGEKKTFIINASAIIQPKGFLVFPKSQTGIALRNDGDTVRLIDQQNTVIDSHGFPGILGFNTSSGRTSDGAGVWSTCTAPTEGSKNSCPEPSVTPTPLVSDTPTPSITPIPTELTPTVVPNTPTPIVEVVYVTHIPTPTPTPIGNVTVQLNKSVMIQAAVVLLSWILLAILAMRNRRKKSHAKKHTHHTTTEGT